MGNFLFGDSAMSQIDQNIAEAQRRREQLLAEKDRQRVLQHERELREGIEPGHEPAQMLAWLFLGDRYSARNVEWMKTNKIGFVLHISDIPTSKAMEETMKEAGVEYIRLPSEDVEIDNIILQFPKAIDFINEGRDAFKSKKDRPNVLVFCDEGVSRSPTVVAAYLLHNGWLLKGTLTHMLALRPSVCPNKGFFKQLLEEESNINGWNSLLEEDYDALFVRM
jgi:predicted protein tyrosine phosphatase